MNTLEHSIAVITGGAAGISLQTGRLFLDKGAKAAFITGGQYTVDGGMAAG